jgi:hypothetical protein
MISLGNFTASGPGVANGNVAVVGGPATITRPFVVNGKVYLVAGVSAGGNGTVTGGESSHPTLVSQAASDATTASGEFSAPVARPARTGARHPKNRWGVQGSSVIAGVLKRAG